MPYGRESNPNSTKRGIVYRLILTDEQKKYFARCFGCRRFIYNHLLAMKNEFDEAQSKLNVSERQLFKFSRGLAILREEYPFLKEIPSWIRANTLNDINRAFNNFYENSQHFGKPKFKRKKDENIWASCTFSNTKGQDDISLDVKNGIIKLPTRQGDQNREHKFLKVVIHRQIREDAIIKSATVKRRPNGNYYVSVTYEYENQAPVKQKPVKVIGFDYSQTEGAVLSTGEEFGTPHAYLKNIERIGELQKLLAGRHKDSKRYEKLRIKIAKLYQKIVNITNDFNHKLSLKIAQEYDVACFEDLNLQKVAMDKDSKFGKKILDNAFGIFRTYVKYKMEERGKWFIKTKKNFPSTQLCSNCGYQNRDIAGKENLKVREWTCPECGCHHDRDFNAATNIANEGLRIAQKQYASLHMTLNNT